MESAYLSKPAKDSLEIFKDAFAPPKPSRTIKAWERAPVPAHAPRLQGQKIWKRTCSKSQREDDKENFDAAQSELEKDGKGSRKRLRLRDARENIGDATWKENLLAKPDSNEEILQNNSTGSSNTVSTAVFPNEGDVNKLRFVPRKRTNTNHVITPRKLLRQATLDGQAQTRSFTRPPHSPPENSRMRKSGRKSIRNSTGGSMPATLLPVVEDESVNEDPTIGSTLSNTGQDDAPILHQAQSEAQRDAAEGALNDKLNILFDLAHAEQTAMNEREQQSSNLLAQFSSPIGSPNQITTIPLNDPHETMDQTPIQFAIHNSTAERSVSTLDINEGHPSRCRQMLETPISISETIEKDADGTIDPQKPASTPNKNFGRTQRKETRRSTRTMRTSSVQAEEQINPAERANSQLNISPTRPAERESKVVTHATEEILQANAVQSSAKSMESQTAQSRELVATISSCKSTTLDPEEQVQENYSCFATNDVNLESPEKVQIPSRFDDALSDDFDISAQLALQLSPVKQRDSIPDQDSKLSPVPAYTFATIPNTLRNEKRLEMASENTPCSFQPLSVSASPANVSCPWLARGSKEISIEPRQNLRPALTSAIEGNLTTENETSSPANENLPESSTPNLTSSELVETISVNAQPIADDHDDTDMLRNFLTRVKANKAAKASTHVSRKKRSLPHSPLRLPLGETTNVSPSPEKKKDEFELGPPIPSPNKRQKLGSAIFVDEDDTIADRKPNRRSGRTRLPVIKNSLGAPSHIPVRRLGQDGDTNVSLRNSEEKELAALTRLNTRKNKGGSHSVAEVLAKKAEDREDPVLRQRLLKEVFDEKAHKVKRERRKTVVWAEELTRYQTIEREKSDIGKEKTKEEEKLTTAEEKMNAVKVGVRSKIALGMVMNGTPAPKRRRAR